MFESRRAHHESSNRNASHFRRLDALRLAGESQCPHRLRLLFPYRHPNRAPAPRPAVGEWNAPGMSCKRRKAATIIARTRAEFPNSVAAAAPHRAAGCREDATLAFGIAPARCCLRERRGRSPSSAPAGARRLGPSSQGSRHGLFSSALRAADLLPLDTRYFTFMTNTVWSSKAVVENLSRSSKMAATSSAAGLRQWARTTCARRPRP